MNPGWEGSFVAVEASVDRARLSVIEALAGTIEVLRVESPPIVIDLLVRLESCDAGDEPGAPAFDCIWRDDSGPEAGLDSPAFDCIWRDEPSPEAEPRSPAFEGCPLWLDACALAILLSSAARAESVGERPEDAERLLRESGSIVDPEFPETCEDWVNDPSDIGPEDREFTIVTKVFVKDGDSVVDEPLDADDPDTGILGDACDPTLDVPFSERNGDKESKTDIELPKLVTDIDDEPPMAEKLFAEGDGDDKTTPDIKLVAPVPEFDSDPPMTETSFAERDGDDEITPDIELLAPLIELDNDPPAMA